MDCSVEAKALTELAQKVANICNSRSQPIACYTTVLDIYRRGNRASEDTSFSSLPSAGAGANLTKEQVHRLFYHLVAGDWLRVATASASSKPGAPETVFIAVPGDRAWIGTDVLTLNMPRVDALRLWREDVAKRTAGPEMQRESISASLESFLTAPLPSDVAGYGTAQPDASLLQALRSCCQARRERLPDELLRYIALRRPVTLQGLQDCLGAEACSARLASELLHIIAPAIV